MKVENPNTGKEQCLKNNKSGADKLRLLYQPNLPSLLSCSPGTSQGLIIQAY